MSDKGQAEWYRAEPLIGLTAGTILTTLRHPCVIVDAREEETRTEGSNDGKLPAGGLEETSEPLG
jgi:hypothetical protein